jgi:hypothetical protein
VIPKIFDPKIMIRRNPFPSDCGGGRRKSSFLRWTI